MDGAEHDHALLKAGKGSANRGVGVAVADFLHGGANHALACIDQEAEQLEQHRARRIERQRHGQLTHVIDVKAALNLLNLRGLNVEALAAACAAFELQHGGAVADVGAVEQGSERSRSSRRDAANHLRQTDRVRTTPWHERELNEPLKLLAVLVFLVPVAIDRQDLVGRLIDADDVRRRSFGIVFDVGEGVDFVDRP